MARLTGVEKTLASTTAVIFRVVRKKLGRVPRPLRIHALSKPNLRGYAMMEGAQEAARAVPAHVKKLAQIRVATRVGCPF